MIEKKKSYQTTLKRRRKRRSQEQEDKKPKHSFSTLQYQFDIERNKQRRNNRLKSHKIKLPPRQKTEQSPSEQTVKKLYSYTPTRSSRRNRNKSSRYYRQLELSMSRSYSGNNALRLFDLLRCIFQWLRDIFFPPRRR